jgi:hypothetical protein
VYRFLNGKHQGKTLAQVPPGYLTSVASATDLPPWLRQMAEEELARRRGRVAKRLPPLPDLPRAEPRMVEGISLDAYEAAVFGQALATGELILEPWVPCASGLPEAWRRWCKANGKAHRVREVPVQHQRQLPR